MTITPEREEKVSFATGGAMSVDDLVVVHKDVTDIQALEDLVGRDVYPLRNSS